MSVPFVITFIHLHYITSCRWSRAVSQMLDVSDLIAPFINLWQDHTEEAFSSRLIENNDMSLQECTAVLLLSSNQTQISHYGNQSLPLWSLKHDCSAVCSFFFCQAYVPWASTVTLTLHFCFYMIWSDIWSLGTKVQTSSSLQAEILYSHSSSVKEKLTWRKFVFLVFRKTWPAVPCCL